MKSSRFLSGRYFISQFRLGVPASLVFTFLSDYRPLLRRGDKTIVAFRFVNNCPDANHMKVAPASGVLSCRGTRHLLCMTPVTHLFYETNYPVAIFHKLLHSETSTQD